MKIILIIICIVAIILLLNYRKKLDQEHKIALKTPGIADKLRKNYPYLINRLLNDPSHTILMERKYDQSIRIGNDIRQELFICLSFNELFIAFIDRSLVVKEWKFDSKHSEYQIINEVSNYFKI